MSRKTSHFQNKEPIFENILRYLRFKRTAKYIKANTLVLDFGCGYQGYFLHKIINQIKKGVGYDTSVNKFKSNKIY